MNFNYLKKELEKEHQTKTNTIKEKINKNLKQELEWNNKQYKGTTEQQKQKLLKYLLNKEQKRHKQELNKLKEIEQTKDFSGELIITVEWKKSYMWGSNPKALTNYGFEGESISGYGYDKLSTATAQALNNHKPLLKELYKKKEQALKELKGKELTNEIKKDKLGYGTGYGTLPYFEGGVGIRSHELIIEKLGLKMKNITSTKNTDVYIIKKNTN